MKFRHHLLLPEKWPKTVDKSTGKRKQLCTFALPTSDSYIHKESNGKTTLMKWIEIRKCPLMHGEEITSNDARKCATSSKKKLLH